MKYITIPNLGKHQHYKDRRPPWMKLHATLLQDYEFSLLNDAEKYQLISLWLLATQLDNKLPDDEKWLCNKTQCSKININKFKKMGLVVHHASNVLADCKQSAIVETYKEETYKQETETEKDLSANANLVNEVFDYWVVVMGKSRKTSKLSPKRKKAIADRINDGYEVETIMLAIDGCKKDAWSMGANDRKKAFNDIELICRTGEKLEHFAESSINPNSDTSFLDEPSCFDMPTKNNGVLTND